MERSTTAVMFEPRKKTHKLIVTAVVILISTIFSVSVSAKEIEQGTVEIEGSFDVSFSSAEQEPEGFTKTKTDTQTVDTSVSYYFAPNVGLGVLLGYENSEATRGAFFSEVTTNFIGPQFTYNISLNDKTSLDLKGAIFLASTKVTSSSPSDRVSDKGDGVGWAIGGGFKYFVTESVSFNGEVAYVSLNMEYDTASVDNIDVDTTSLSVGVGISVYIF